MQNLNLPGSATKLILTKPIMGKNCVVLSVFSRPLGNNPSFLPSFLPSFRPSVRLSVRPSVRPCNMFFCFCLCLYDFILAYVYFGVNLKNKLY